MKNFEETFARAKQVGDRRKKIFFKLEKLFVEEYFPKYCQTASSLGYTKLFFDGDSIVRPFRDCNESETEFEYGFCPEADWDGKHSTFAIDVEEGKIQEAQRSPGTRSGYYSHDYKYDIKEMKIKRTKLIQLIEHMQKRLERLIENITKECDKAEKLIENI